MKNVLILIFIILTTSASVFPQKNIKAVNELNSLYQGKQFFRLKNALARNSSELQPWEVTYYNALLYNVFNNPAASNSAINELLQKNKDDLTDSMEVNLYNSKLLNSVNLFLYKDAYEITEILLSEYRDKIDSTEMDDLQNSVLIWKAGTTLAPQSMQSKGDTKLAVTRDLAGLVNVNVNVNGLDELFIFDTGANFSTISESFAKKLGLTFLDGHLSVGAITGKDVSTKLAYAKSLKVGNLNFSNVLFLVMPDEALTFAGGAYVINGILGFPVIKEMKEIQITKENIFIPFTPGTSEHSNLALDGFVPLIETFVNNDTLVFSFDTGARKTMMYFPYYEDHKSMIDSVYKSEEIKFGGAGGDVKLMGFNLDDMNFRISKGKTVLSNVSLLSEKIKDKDKYISGNLGSDFINTFGKMIINFEDMFVEFAD